MQDVTTNITALKTAIESDSLWLNRAKPKLITIQKETITVDSANAVIKQIIFISKVGTQTGTYEDITNSGNLNIISDYILKKQIARAQKLGLTFYTGPELEFFLFKKENGEIKTLPHDKAGYFDFSTDLAVDIRKEITDCLIDLDIDVETLHHEVAEGQHEINFSTAAI